MATSSLRTVSKRLHSSIQAPVSHCEKYLYAHGKTDSRLSHTLVGSQPSDGPKLRKDGLVSGSVDQAANIH
jgi:hypothetical protein